MFSEKIKAFFLDPINIHLLSQFISENKNTFFLSFDIGKSHLPVITEGSEILLTPHIGLPFPTRDIIKPDDHRTILIFKDNQWQRWQYFDEESEQFYKPVFVAPGKPPTVEISGIKMHVTENGDPMLDTSRKLKALGKVGGRVLDTCCGLGYTAIALGKLKSVTEVICIEQSRTMLQICRENPWSAELFESSKIGLICRDSAELVHTFPDGYFSAVLHDPPRYSLAPQLYEENFYRQLWRILSHRGRIYHYTGGPKKHLKRGLAERTIARLSSAGFVNVKKSYRGVVAQKG